MNITVFGATGKVGSIVVQEALRRGHSVTAFAYHIGNLQSSPKLRFVEGDVHDPGPVKEALMQTDAVISALGSWGTKTKDILSAGMANIIPTMEQRGIKRIISLTGADARDSADKPKLLNKLTHTLFNITAHDVMQDGEQHIALLRSSQLDWTVVRSPVMTNKPAGNGYKLQHELIGPWHTIPRVLVAHSLVDLVESTEFNHSAPVIVRVK